MIYEHIYSDIYECQSQIEKDFKIDLEKNTASLTVLMRGENYPYQKTESSMKRFLTAEDGKTMKHFDDVSPFIDFEDIYAKFHSERYRLNEEEGVGFLQHYGFPTDLFDLSLAFATARFFAVFGRTDEPIGIIGVFDKRELERHFTITDLSRHPFALRPKQQVAYAARPYASIIDLKSERCDELFTSKWYKFYKCKDDFAFVSNHEQLIYPTEAELAHFFGRDFDEFFKSHWAHQEMTEAQQNLVLQKLDAIRNQLTKPS